MRWGWVAAGAGRFAAGDVRVALLLAWAGLAAVAVLSPRLGPRAVRVLADVVLLTPLPAVLS